MITVNRDILNIGFGLILACETNMLQTCQMHDCRFCYLVGFIISSNKGQNKATVLCYAPKSLHKLTICIYSCTIKFFVLVSSESGIKVGKAS